MPAMLKKLFRFIPYLLIAGLFFLNSYVIIPNPVSFPSGTSIPVWQNKCSFPIIAVGDLQRTSLRECIIMGRESNDYERKEVIENISEQNPGSVVLLGDMVFEGDNIDQWKYFDNLIAPIKRKKIPMFPVIGNHDLWGLNSLALRYMAKRFAVLERSHCYTQVSDSVALIFLDSNDGEYTKEQWQRQKNWFSNKLRLYNNDPSIKGILVFAHHPPYTNSTVTGDEMQVQNDFVPAFDSSKKTLAFITGHAHTYERFIKNGKTFIISGGGGGPRVTLKPNSEGHHDYYNGPSPRPFNYLLINRKDDGLVITVRGVNKGSDKFFTLEQFTLLFYSTKNEYFSGIR
jgi:Icc-related predicted phosphoesterase